jgi:epoxyqueuosine reductase QueG
MEMNNELMEQLAKKESEHAAKLQEFVKVPEQLSVDAEELLDGKESVIVKGGTQAAANLKAFARNERNRRKRKRQQNAKKAKRLRQTEAKVKS